MVERDNVAVTPHALSELMDVKNVAPVNNKAVLAWVTADSQWEPKEPVSVMVVTAVNAAASTPTQAEFNAVITDLNALKAKLTAAGVTL